MANIALPLTANFVGELLIFQGVFCNNTLVALLGATSMICSGGYSLLAYGRVAYGSCKPYYIRRCDLFMGEVSLLRRTCALRRSELNYREGGAALLRLF